MFYILFLSSFNLAEGGIDDQAQYDDYVQSVISGFKHGSALPVRVRADAMAGSAAVTFSPEWKRDITSTVFWVGEPASGRSQGNRRSAWDGLWELHYGGLDAPGTRTVFFTPASFRPHLNPFYVALPYCDIMNGRLRPEAGAVIPWFNSGYRGPGVSVCKDHWVAIYARGRVCFAQWEDVGPFETDDWQYVFGPQAAPRHGHNGNAGIDVSPAVQRFLGLSSLDKVNWRFVDGSQVWQGPWSGWD